MNSEFVWPHLSALPALRALIRSIEHRLLSEYQPYDSPVLDIGVGDGLFASVALGGLLDAGIDVNLGSLRDARTRGVHRVLVRASATAMPFRSDYFATAISNCVVEHIPNLEGTLAEAWRVLRPGGTLLLTVPTNYLEENLMIPRVLRSVGLHGASRSYLGWFRRMQVHFHLLTSDEWTRAAEVAGFTVVRTRGYMSARATRFFELGHYSGWHNLLAQRATGHWVIWPWRPRFYPVERLLAGFASEPEHLDDSCLLVEARKSPARADGHETASQAGNTARSAPGVPPDRRQAT
jgi:SAM-dependent methyltransferase